jgi:hypothetical protein
MNNKHTLVLDRYFYLLMTLLIAGLVTYGFSHTIDQKLIHAVPRRPWILYLHAAVFSGWLVFLILQAALIRTHHISLHRRFGWFGVILGATIPVVGISTAIRMDHFRMIHFPDTVSPAFLIVTLFDMASFTIAFGLAIHCRRKPELHRRFILIASAALTSAAFARFPQGFVSNWFYVWADALVVLAAAWDIVVSRRVHTVYLWTLPSLIACQILVIWIVVTENRVWLKIANAILR